MNSIDFAQLDAADAAKWLEFVEKRGPSRLAELAGFLDDDGGPIGQADATWESLSPLWEWAVGFVARGGSESRGRRLRKSSRTLAFGVPQDATAFGAVAEDLGHYVFEVLRRLDPTTHWSLSLSPPTARVKDAHHHETGVRFGTSWWNLESDLPRLLRRGTEGDTGASDATALQRWAAERIGLAETPASPRGSSILTEYVGAVVKHVPTPIFTRRAFAAGSSYSRYPLHVLRIADPFDDKPGFARADLLQFLSTFDFEFDEAFGNDALLDAETGFLGWLYSRGVAVEIGGDGGRILSVFFDPLAVMPDEWLAFLRAAEEFARAHAGELHSDGT